VRYPLLKIIDAGKERRDVVLTMRANNRLPGFVGDLRSRWAPPNSVRAGSVKSSRIWFAHCRCRGQLSIGDATERFSAEIAGWPDGTYEADVYVDSDPAATRTSTCTSRSPSRVIA